MLSARTFDGHNRNEQGCEVHGLDEEGPKATQDAIQFRFTERIPPHFSAGDHLMIHLSVRFRVELVSPSGRFAEAIETGKNLIDSPAHYYVLVLHGFGFVCLRTTVLAVL
jgi:hypothetical protein